MENPWRRGIIRGANRATEMLQVFSNKTAGYWHTERHIKGTEQNPDTQCEQMEIEYMIK